MATAHDADAPEAAPRANRERILIAGTLVLIVIAYLTLRSRQQPAASTTSAGTPVYLGGLGDLSYPPASAPLTGGIATSTSSGGATVTPPPTSPPAQSPTPVPVNGGANPPHHDHPWVGPWVGATPWGAGTSAGLRNRPRDRGSPGAGTSGGVRNPTAAGSRAAHRKGPDKG